MCSHCGGQRPKGRPSEDRPVPAWKIRSGSKHGKSYENKTRRRGRVERNPNDTPLRDGNRDRVIGLLTERAVKTLIYYLSETNMHVYYWLCTFYRDHAIPRDGHWDDVSGETFLRTLLNMPIEHAAVPMGRNASPLHSLGRGCGVDPRNLAQRIMDIRTQLAAEMIQDLKEVSAENATLMRETVTLSFNLNNVVAHPVDKGP
ncbi:hypothetical protein WJX73_007665 [Symbiochloris irregularis]|uniref:Uncharacterized protein n=1 Tax=Symbiochloris irregularis TaxID=706552 RepID=A0AAW1P019_9CHLO